MQTWQKFHRVGKEVEDQGNTDTIKLGTFHPNGLIGGGGGLTGGAKPAQS